MAASNLNNLNALPLNIACETAPSEDDNNVEMSNAPDVTEQNIDNKIRKPSEEKQNFRELLQDRVLKRLQEKAEYGKRNVASQDGSVLEKDAVAPPLKKYFSNEDLWKRVEGRVAAKKAIHLREDETPVEKVSNNLKSSSSEDIKSRIRSMSKAIGLASNIQNQIKANDKENTAPKRENTKKISSSTLNPLDIITQNNKTGLEQASSVYEETLSQGRFMEDDYFSLPSVGSTQSLFSNISEYRTFVNDRTDESALAKYLQCHSNILQDQDIEAEILTEDRLLQYFSELTKVMKQAAEDITPMGSPRSTECLTPRSLTPTNSICGPATMSRALSPANQGTDRYPRDFDSPSKKESSCQCNDMLDDANRSLVDAVMLSDANCQTSIVLEEILSPANQGTATMSRAIDSQTSLVLEEGSWSARDHVDYCTRESNTAASHVADHSSREGTNQNTAQWSRDQNTDSNFIDELLDKDTDNLEFTAGLPSITEATSFVTHSNNNGSRDMNVTPTNQNTAHWSRDQNNQNTDPDMPRSPVQIIVQSANQNTASLPRDIQSANQNMASVPRDIQSANQNTASLPRDATCPETPGVGGSAKSKILKNLADANLLFSRGDNCSLNNSRATPINNHATPHHMSATPLNISATPINMSATAHSTTCTVLSANGGEYTIPSEIVENENCTTINIPCDAGLVQSDSSNIQVMVNIWSTGEDGDVSRASVVPHQHSHQGVLTCTSIPQFDEGEVDRLFEDLNYQSEEKKEKMRRLLDDLDTEHLLTSIQQDLSGEENRTAQQEGRDEDNAAGDVVQDAARDVITPRNYHDEGREMFDDKMLTPRSGNCIPDAFANISPRSFANISPRSLANISPRSLANISPRSLANISPPDYYTGRILSEDLYAPPVILGQLDSDELSLPSVPSYFEDDATLCSDDEHSIEHDDRFIDDDEHSIEHDNRFIDDDKHSIEHDNRSIEHYEHTLEHYAQTPVHHMSEEESCDTVILNTTLHHDLLSKSNQTLALPFRLVRFLPVDHYRDNKDNNRDNKDMCDVVEVHDNTVATQVDMSSRQFSVRQELQWLDHETQLQARVIEKHVLVK